MRRADALSLKSNPIRPQLSYLASNIMRTRMAYLVLVGDPESDAWDGGHVDEREPCGSAGPSEIFVALDIHVYQVN